MNRPSALRALPRRVWVVAVVVFCLVVAVGTGVTVAVNNSAAEQAAAERAAAEQAAAEAAAEAAGRLESAQDDADRRVSDGEAVYADSGPWAAEDDRAALRATLDELIALRADDDATAEELESAAEEVVSARAVMGNPPGPVELVCGDIDVDVPFTVRRVGLGSDGSGQFAELWAAQLRCDAGMSGSPVRESVAVQTAIQRAALAAAKNAGYGEYHDGDDQILYAVYEGCGGSGSGSYYGDLSTLSSNQAKEALAWLTLCPNHPDAERWRAASGAGQAQQEAEANGARVAPGGTYTVPGQMTTGSFVAENVNNCYWETRDTNGDIIDNDFVLAAPRVVADVTDSAVVFTTQGACGYWNRQ